MKNSKNVFSQTFFKMVQFVEKHGENKTKFFMKLFLTFDQHDMRNSDFSKKLKK